MSHQTGHKALDNMTGYLIKPEVIKTVYIAKGDDSSIHAVSSWLNNLGLKTILSKRNKLANVDWRFLAEQYNHNIQSLLECELFLALLDDNLTSLADTCVEMGLAYANGIPILGLCSSQELRASPMINGMCRSDEQLAYTLEELFDMIQEYVEISKVVTDMDEPE